MGPCQALPLNSVPIPFESELFSGVIVIYIRHLSTTPSQLFKGKKRLTWIALQVMGWLLRAIRPPPPPSVCTQIWLPFSSLATLAVTIACGLPVSCAASVRRVPASSAA